jgi:hypothetical protein
MFLPLLGPAKKELVGKARATMHRAFCCCTFLGKLKELDDKSVVTTNFKWKLPP